MPVLSQTDRYASFFVAPGIAVMRSIMFCLVVMVTVSDIAGQQQGDRDLNRVKSTKSGSGSDGLFAESHALVFGVSDYSNGLKPLPGVKSDVVEVKKALEKHGFKVTVVMNPTQPEFDQAIRKFISRYGLARDNRLLVYFAGHGHTIGSRGYLVPVNAPHPDDDEPGFINAAISFDMIQVYARMMRSNQALFVFDSCFSGSLFEVRGASAIPPSIASIAGLPIRQFIASGSADQTVPDRSVFLRQFVEALDGAADIPPRDGFITGTELGIYLHRTVTDYTANDSGKPMQTPQYGKLRDPDYDRGEFVFQYKLEEGAPSSSTDARISQVAPPPVARNTGIWKVSEEKNLPVFANQDWVSSGIRLNGGEQIKISAAGQVSLGRGVYAGPEGSYDPDPVRPVPECRLGSLVARIGVNKPFCVGAGTELTTQGGGELLLTVNEGSRRDNSRSLLVKIQVFKLTK